VTQLVQRECGAMSRRKKLVREPTYEPVRFVELGDKHKQSIGERPSGRVFVGIPTLPVQPLTAKERAGIAEKAGIKLTNAEWGSVDQARQLYTAARRNELNGVSARQLQIRLGTICKAADVLLDLMDGGPGKPGNRNTSKHKDDKNRLLSESDRLSYRSVDEIAWKRVFEAEKPAFGRDDIYPCVSQLYRRATLAFEQSRSEAAMLGWPSSWDQLIWKLAALFEAKGLKAARSKPADHGTTQKLSPFAKFVFAVWATLPDDVARPRRRGSAADILAIARALEKGVPVSNKKRSATS
jgi:hypothetical protein